MRVAANTSVRRCELQAAGGFNPALTRGFDAELGLRLHQAGVSFVFEPAAAAQQLYTKSTRDLLLHDAPAYGRTDVQLTRMQGSYRTRSPLALLAEGSAAKRATRRLAAEAGRFPVPERGPSAAARSAYSAAFLAGAAREAGGWGALRAEFGVRLPVLLYHHVGPARHDIPAGLTIAPAEFERQLTWLEAHGHTPIRVADWLAWRDRAAPLPPRPVLLTFDDGYADLAEHAFPTLERRRWPATVFVVTGHTVNEWDGWRAPLLGPEELREWSGRGIGIGGHSRSHADLTRLGPEALTHEIAGCARDLRALGIDPVAFAYPFGRTNAAVHAAVAADFPLAFTTAEGMNGLWTDAATQHRTPVLARHPLNDFAARVRLGWSPRERLVGGLAGVMRRAR
jgi:peptidoglycan/xylan/chitin deacetylase (PgdA/CDA1 family)